MSSTTGYQGMVIVGLLWGIGAFFVVRVFEEPPYWIGMSAGLAVFLLAFLCGNHHRRLIACDGDDLVITDGKRETRIGKDEILHYRITRISSLCVRITTREQEVISVPINGFFSESKVVGVFDSLGIRKG